MHNHYDETLLIHYNQRETIEDTRTSLAQPMFTCSKSTVETVKHCVKDVIEVVLVSLLLTLNSYHTLFLVFPLSTLKKYMSDGRL